MVNPRVEGRIEFLGTSTWGGDIGAEALRLTPLSHALSEVGDDASSERVTAKAGRVLTE